MKQHADGFASSSKSPPKETREMSSQEFIARINALIPSPNEEANKNLLDFSNSLWLRLKEDLYNTFSFISRHFGRFAPLELLYNATARSVYNGVTIKEAIQQFDCNMEIRHPWETDIILDSEPKMVEKLTQLMPDSPIIAAHINLDADSGAVATEINPLCEKLRDELDELSHGQQQKTSEKSALPSAATR